MTTHHEEREGHEGAEDGGGYRVDVLVQDKPVLELKSVDAILGIHQAQLLTCMKLAGIKTGLLINFNVSRLKAGIRRFVLYPLRVLRGEEYAKHV